MQQRNALEWVVNKLSSFGVGLRPGDIIATGTMTGAEVIEAGQTAVGDFGSLGKVEICCAAG